MAAIDGAGTCSLGEVSDRASSVARVACSLVRHGCRGPFRYPLSSFFGRKREPDKVRSLFREGKRLVTVTGRNDPPGLPSLMINPERTAFGYSAKSITKDGLPIHRLLRVIMLRAHR
jgi:hypothetical protein